jgi:hypothetical protein
MSTLDLDRLLEQGKQDYRAKYGDTIPATPDYGSDDDAAVGPPLGCSDLDGEQITFF